MQAVRLHGVKDLRVEDVPEPAGPEAGEVLLAVSAAGICGSDIHNYKTGAWITRVPSVAGHEFTGTVRALGNGVAHVSVGDRVIVDSRVVCGTCPACADGLGQVCESLGFIGEVMDGGFAEAVILPARNVLKAPAGVQDRHLAMAEPLAVALHAINRLAAPAGAEMVIAGCGPIGALVALLASVAGHSLHLFDRNDARASKVAVETGGTVIELEALDSLHFRHAVDTTGSATVVSALTNTIGGTGRLALVGIGNAAKVIDPMILVEREITLLGCHAFADNTLEEVGRMLPSLTPRLDALIADVISLRDVPERYESLLRGEVTGIKTIIDCRGVSVSAPSRTARIRALAQVDPVRAECLLADLIVDLFAMPVSQVTINADRYSLNSLNGFLVAGGEEYFFKFHQEEGEEAMTGEYYRAEILAKEGLPVDQPVHVSTLPGEQLLVYHRRDVPRFSDVLFELDQTPDPRAITRAVAAEARLNDRLLAVARKTLAPITPDEAAVEPIHRLFYERLVDLPAKAYPGGRLAAFYVGKSFEFPHAVTLSWEEFATARPCINGQEYDSSLKALFDRAHERLSPLRLADAGGIVAHGDAHNANVWHEAVEPVDRLSLFDPAFAGDKVPSLLGEIKSTFHNCWAHPFWLYHPDLATREYDASVRLGDGRLHIDTDWRPTPLRARLLGAKAQHFWKPWLAVLAARKLLPEDWEDVMRLSFFLCPTLVMSLRAGSEGGTHTPVSSAIAFSVALSAGARPCKGRNMFTDFFDEIRPS